MGDVADKRTVRMVNDQLIEDRAIALKDAIREATYSPAARMDLCAMVDELVAGVFSARVLPIAGVNHTVHAPRNATYG